MESSDKFRVSLRAAVFHFIVAVTMTWESEMIFAASTNTTMPFLVIPQELMSTSFHSFKVIQYPSWCKWRSPGEYICFFSKKRSWVSIWALSMHLLNKKHADFAFSPFLSLSLSVFSLSPILFYFPCCCYFSRVCIICIQFVYWTQFERTNFIVFSLYSLWQLPLSHYSVAAWHEHILLNTPNWPKWIKNIPNQFSQTLP